MKKIFFLIFLFYFALIPSSYAYTYGDNQKSFFVDCAGTVVIGSKLGNQKKNFFQTYEIEVAEYSKFASASGKRERNVTKLRISDSDELWLRPQSIYHVIKPFNPDEVKVDFSQQDNALLTVEAENLKVGGPIFNSYLEKLNLRTGIMDAAIFISSDDTSIGGVIVKFKGACTGGDEILSYLQFNYNEQIFPDIADNDLVPVASGTGFLISKNGVMITNHHVIEGCSNVKAFYDGKEFDTKVIASDKVNDLAIIEADINSKKAFSISNEDGNLLEEVIVAGYPLGKKVSSSIKATSGTITALAGLGDNYSEFQTDAALNSGNSGGPIINEMGNVVGVAVSKISDEGVESFNFGIKTSILKSFAKANGIKFLPENNKLMPKKELGKLITEATIYLDCWMTGKQLRELMSQENQDQKAMFSKFK